MEVSGVKENEEEYLRLHLEEQLSAYHVKEIHYCTDKQTLVVCFDDDKVVDKLLDQVQFIQIDGKDYCARRLYISELLDVSNVEFTILYLDTYVGKVVWDYHLPDEHRLVVAFDAAEAFEKLCQNELHIIDECVSFRVNHVSKSGLEYVQPGNGQQRQHERQQQREQENRQEQEQLHVKQREHQHQHQGSRVQSSDWQRDNQRRQQFFQQQQQKRQLQQHQESQRQLPQQHKQKPSKQPQQLLRLQQQRIQFPEVRQGMEHHEEQPDQEQQQQAELLLPYGQARDETLQLKNSVVVTGVPLTTSKPALELELTKQWKQTGIEYEQVDYNPSTGIAVVSFPTSHDAQAALRAEKGGMEWSITTCADNQTVCDLLGDVVLLIENISLEFSTEALWCWMKVAVGEFAHTIVYSSSYNVAAAIFSYFADLDLDVAAVHAKSHVVDSRRLHITAIRYTKKAQAMGVPESVDIGMLKYQLENSQIGGQKGSVVRLDKAGRGTVTITFCDERALVRATSRKLTLLGQEVLLVPIFEDLGPVTSSAQVFSFSDVKRLLDATDSATVIPAELTITGFDSPSIDESVLRQFLSQRRVSGGGEIQSFFFSKEKAVVTFVDSECATRVYEKYRCDGLQLCGCRLSASLRTFDISSDAHKNQVLLRNIGVASDDSLKYWLWGVSSIPVHRIDFVCKNEDQQLCAIAFFERDVDYRRLVLLMRVIKLDGLFIEPDVVCLPRSLVVANVPEGTHADLVELPFGQFGVVQEVRQICPMTWIVTFIQSGDAACARQTKILLRGSVELQTAFYTDFHVKPDARKKGQRGKLTLSLDFVDKAIVAFALAKRKADLDDLLQPFGSKISTEEEQEVPVVVCSLPQSDPVYRDVVQRWQTLRQACLAYFAPFRSESIPVSNGVYEKLVACERYLSIANQRERNVLVFNRLSRDRSVHEIIVVGTSRDTKDAFAALQSVVKDINESMVRNMQRTVHLSDRVAELPLKLLDIVGFCKNARERCKELDVDIDWVQHVIRFEGLPADIAASTAEMKRILSSSTEELVEASTAMLTLLAKNEIREFIDEQLKQEKLTGSVVWGLKPPAGVCVRGVDLKNTHDAAVVIRRQIVEMPINLDVDSERLTDSEKWKTFSRDIIKKYDDNLVLNKLNSSADQNTVILRLSCKAADSDRIVEEVQEFLRRHTLKEDFVRLPRLTMEFVVKFMQDSIIMQVEKVQSRNFVQLRPVFESEVDSAKTGFKIIGNQDGIINAKRTLASLMKTHKVCVRQHSVSFPGAEKYFTSQETVLKRIGDETKTVICISSGTGEEMELLLDESGLLTASQISLPSGTELHVLKGDIVQLNCDAIINPANGHLQHGGGLASIIADKGGQTVVDECTAFIRKNGQLFDGQVCVTAAGALPCKKIIHAVGPQWQGGTRNEESKLFSAVQNSLATAVQLGLASIAVPPISSGIYGYPLEKCTKTIVESVVDFCKCATKPPKKIVFIDNKNDGAKLFKEWIDKLVTKAIGKPADAAAQGVASLSVKAPKDKRPSGVRKRLENVDKSVQPVQPQSISVGNTVVELVEESLIDQKVDVMINSVSRELRLDAGVLSKIVSTAAGPAMQLYLDQNFPNVSADETIVISQGFQLPCKLVFHCCCPHWNNGSGNKALHDLLTACLNEAAKCNMASVAIPAIGAGQLGFPPKESAKITYEAVLQYCRDHPSSTIRLIRLVVFGSPTVVAAYREHYVAVQRRDGKGNDSMTQLQSSLSAGRQTSNTDGVLQRVQGVALFSLRLSICGTENSITNAVKAVDDYCRKHITEYVIKDAEDCTMLSDSQVEDLVKQGADDGVALEIDRRSCCITIRSLERFAAQTLQQQVRNILTGQQVERLRQETLTSRCQWQFRDDKNQWNNYDTSLNAKLEIAFQGGQTSLAYTSSDGINYVVIFKDMKCNVVGKVGAGVDVQRLDKEQRLPAGWTNKLDYLEETVTAGTQEYDNVKNAFFATAASTLKIAEIRRIQNPTLMKQYELQMVKVKENMQSGSILPIERWLWHGTDGASLQKICMHGFNRSYCGVNGIVYGQGVYFARDASYSVNYSKPYLTGMRHMIFSRVLTGEFQVGNNTVRTPSPRPHGKQANYDTTVDNISNPTIFVVYHDSQAYPAYVVQFC